MKRVRIVSCPPKMKDGGKVRNDIPVYSTNQPSQYDQFTGNIYMNPADSSNPDVYPHEAYHELQDREGRLSDMSQWSGPLKRPSIVNTDEMKADYFNRRQQNMNTIDRINTQHTPEIQFIPKDYRDSKFNEPMIYNVPWSVEGEAVNYANSLKKQYGGQSMKKVRITGTPAMAYGGHIKGSPFELDKSWNPNTYQAMAGVNPEPDPYARTGRTLPESDQPNAILEKREMAIGDFTGDGTQSLMGVDAGTHESGNDAPVVLPPNSFVFSDTKSLKIKDPEILKMFNTSKPSTPAQIAKRYDLQKFTKVVASPHSDEVSRKTAEMMISNYTDKLNTLAAIQEEIKAQKGLNNDTQAPMQQYGGAQQYADGGGTGPTLPYYGFNSVKDNQDMLVGNNPAAVDASIYMGGMPNAGKWSDDRNGWRTQFANSYDAAYPAYTEPKYRPSWNQTDDFDQPVGNTNLNGQTGVLPDLPPQTPQPTNLQADNTQIGNNLGSATYTQPKFTSPTPDKWGIASSLYNAATIHKYAPWEAPVNAVTPNMTFLDPTRALAANSEQANSSSYNAALSGNAKAARANSLAYQGQAAGQAADILGRYNNENVAISNRGAEEASAISNRLSEMDSARRNRLYQGNVIANQQYDNATREGRADILRQYQNAWKDRQAYDLMNKTSPYYYIDPQTGERKFKSPEAQAALMNVTLGREQGYSPDVAEKVNATYQQLLKQPAYQSPHGQEEALKIAQRVHGLGEHETVSYGAYGAPKGTRESGVYSGPAAQKFGGLTNHQLRKFITKRLGGAI